jgi:hypothetical protein
MPIRYGLNFPQDWDEAQQERFCIQNGGQWKEPNGKVYGDGLLAHFKRYWQLLWPADSQNEWTDLILENVLKHQFTSLVGGASSWKSGTIARLVVMDWSCFPDCTSVIMSSTDMEGLRSKVYAEVTMVWHRANELYDWFPGFPVDSKCVITFTDIEEDKARDLRNSIVGVPCKTSSGTFIGMGKFSGRKNRRVWCIGEEYQFMQTSILQAQDNLISNSAEGPMHGYYPKDYQDPQERGLPRRGYKAVFVGNTNPSVPDNPLDIVSEPENGWGSVPQATETVGITQVWKCKKHPKHPVQCYCINLDALDSPNSKHPIERPRWVHMAGPHKLAAYTVGSESYWSNGRGIFKFGLAEFKVITREVCEQFHAFDQLIWDGSELTNIGMCDASYGAVGGDRCPVGWLQFGKCLDGVIRILFRELWLCPVTIRKGMIPEDQIAAFTRDKMESVNVLPENFFFDGRGSLAMSFARLWSPRVEAIEFGGACTNRPAGPDIYVIDEKTQVRRLKKASEHYRKFVTELIWSWRYAIESDQIRGLTLDIVLDAQPREWRKVAGDKIEIETKGEMRKRTGISPDLADMFETGLEGARRRGFNIAKLAPKSTDARRKNDYLDSYVKGYEKMMATKELQGR